MDNITLIGMPGSGKSTVGVVLAKRLGFGFLDTDLLLQQREGRMLQDILNTQGLERFLDAEERAVCSVSCRQHVIAPGGSVVYRERSMAHLAGLGQIVYLYLPFDELTGRIRNLATRGIAMAPGESLQGVYRQRAPLYEKYAGLTVDCTGHTLEETVQAVMDALAQ